MGCFNRLRLCLIVATVIHFTEGCMYCCSFKHHEMSNLNIVKCEKHRGVQQDKYPKIQKETLAHSPASQQVAVWH